MVAKPVLMIGHTTHPSPGLTLQREGIMDLLAAGLTLLEEKRDVSIIFHLFLCKKEIEPSICLIYHTLVLLYLSVFEEKDRRHYDEDIFRYEEERRRDYREYDRKYVEDEYERRHKVDRDDEYFRKSSNSKYDDKYEDRYSKYDERHDGKYSKYDERYDGKSSKYEEKNEGRSSQYDGKYDDGMSNDKYLKRDDKPEGRSSKHGKKYGEKSRKDKQESRLSEREESHTPKKNIKSM